MDCIHSYVLRLVGYKIYGFAGSDLKESSRKEPFFKNPISQPGNFCILPRIFSKKDTMEPEPGRRLEGSEQTGGKNESCDYDGKQIGLSGCTESRGYFKAF